MLGIVYVGGGAFTMVERCRNVNRGAGYSGSVNRGARDVQGWSRWLRGRVFFYRVC